MTELSQLIASSNSILIVSHVNPDGDAVGSLCGFALALQQLGKTTYPVLIHGVPDTFGFVPGSDQVMTSLPSQADLCILLDMNDISRSGIEEVAREYANQGKLVAIDHHPKGDLAKLATICIQEISVSSTGELLTRVINELGIRLTPDIATALLTGIYTDTGGFQHDNATTQTLETAADLMRRGAKLHTIAQQVSHTKNIAALKLLGIALERMFLTQEGCSVSVLTPADFEACGASGEDIAGIVNELNSVPIVKMALLLCEVEPGTIRGTLRSGEQYRTPVNVLGKLCGGGGHPKAAGFILNGTLVHDAGIWQIKPVEQIA